MGIQSCIILAIIFIVRVHDVTSASWEYSGAKGPSNWATSYATCGGSSQSPIDIVTTSVTQATLGEIAVNNYATAPTSMTLKNTGYTVQIDIDGTQTISGGGLSTTYTLAQLHFHWGSSSSQLGSEHTVNGQRLPLEVHFVHYDSATYSNLTYAADKSNGLAVLGFFYEISSSDNTNLNPFLDYISDIVNSGSSKVITSFALSSLLPSDMKKFYRYSGSLTTPGCYESVTWTVFDTKIPISNAQLAKFYTTKTQGGSAVENNYRPVQAVNSRVIQASFNPNSAATSRPIGAIFIISVFFTSIFKY